MIAVIRVRGTAHVTRKIRETLSMMRLFKSNHMVLLAENKSQQKMIDKVKDYVTFGQITQDTLAMVLEKRGRLEGDKLLTTDYLKEKKMEGFAGLAKELIEGKTKMQALGIKPVFRLNPPSKGYERNGVKKPFTLGGALGNRREKINVLIGRMS
ncbi:MAG TPA: 50S ribosomal protein L30 [Candidatus Diapherotrites archaeon]|uniref:Large ribosomal subunit protein uL30 n=1 Tax=Candidatus Iainarchaeum sp. TaxID=3101447 RepID=A0A7J4J2C0_9ARCH|nr:50S ribosomal protein L30 [Candidatus Diapherotrites archaeon]